VKGNRNEHKERELSFRLGDALHAEDGGEQCNWKEEVEVMPWKVMDLHIVVSHHGVGGNGVGGLQR
jgi:hypothetical protein